MTGCEWNPKQGRAALESEKAHAFAAVSLGRGKWHVCAKCAALPEFERYRSRKSLKPTPTRERQ